jgi:AcrR family transcriptional regulator
MSPLEAKKRSERRPEDRRVEILDAAVKVFVDKGFTETTVADIATAAGVAKGTFYLYFESKEHLLGALKERLVDEMTARVIAYHGRLGQDDWWGLIDGMLEELIDYTFDQRDLVFIFVREPFGAKTLEIFQTSEKRMNEMFADGIRRGVEAGVFDVDDPEATAVLLHHALDGALLEALVYSPELDKERIKASSKQLVRKVLAPPHWIQG